MRRLRIITSLLVVFATSVILSYPITVGVSPPSKAPRSAKREHAIRLITFATIASVAWFAAGLSALLLSRRIRSDYETEIVRNLTDLVTSIPQERKDVGTES